MSKDVLNFLYGAMVGLLTAVFIVMVTVGLTADDTVSHDKYDRLYHQYQLDRYEWQLDQSRSRDDILRLQLELMER